MLTLTNNLILLNCYEIYRSCHIVPTMHTKNVFYLNSLIDELQRISTLLRTITSEDKEDKELVSKKPEFLQEDLFGCADNFQGPDKLVGSGGKRS